MKLCQCEACWPNGVFSDSHVCKTCGRSRSHGPCACSFEPRFGGDTGKPRKKASK
jgi:hypothetical protein